MTLLAARGLSRHYAGVVAVDQVDLDVPEGGVHAVIGPNGAGKTTLFNLISGLVAPSAGRILFDGHDITRLPSDRRARLGLARSFQNIRVFGHMTVLENALTGLHPHLSSSLTAIVAGLPRFRREERSAVARASEALDLVGLLGRARERATALSYGDQRRLEIARAVAGRPRLLLLDEPAAGMNPAETVALGALIRVIVEVGTTVLLVEHNMPFVMNLSDSVTVLNFGQRIFVGSPEEARQDGRVIEAYLGAKVAARLAGARG
jgi:branched-chain amino acid transport system ATP-binding protein